MFLMQIGHVRARVECLPEQHTPALLEQLHGELGVGQMDGTSGRVAGQPGEFGQPFFAIRAGHPARCSLGQQTDRELERLHCRGPVRATGQGGA